MNEIADTRTLALQGAQRVVQAAMARAVALGQPMCVALVDAGGNLMAFARRDGAKALSAISSTIKVGRHVIGAVAAGSGIIRGAVP